MVKNTINVFARIKPERNSEKVVNYKIRRRPKKHLNEEFLILTAPERFTDCIDNRPVSWNFSFHRIFEHDISQDDVFETVARPIVNSVFDGYNATIFAYGQTGSGKTYSITGEPGINSEQGILPRTLQYVFDIVRKNPMNLYSIEVAYLEIYNENGYDLLVQRKQREASTRLEDLPRVIIQEDESGTLHLKNLSFVIVENEKEALKFLSDGDTCRAISETPMNPRSSRSHCIFTIVVSVKKSGADRYTRAKMHLVDLAGSERVYKCSIQGAILTEAKHINLSLHFLEHVIVCLGQENQNHVPYRNSLLTSILRDSLGGNCLTTMLATLSVSAFNLEETISTCRFAQRVALVKNDVNLTFELDTKSENLLLKMENERLRKEIEEIKKTKFSELPNRESTSSGSLEYYKNLVIQRDNEISHLISLLKKEKKRGKLAIKQVPRDPAEVSRDEKSTQFPSSRVSGKDVAEIITKNSEHKCKNVETDQLFPRTGHQRNDCVVKVTENIVPTLNLEEVRNLDETKFAKFSESPITGGIIRIDGKIVETVDAVKTNKIDAIKSSPKCQDAPDTKMKNKLKTSSKKDEASKGSMIVDRKESSESKSRNETPKIDTEIRNIGCSVQQNVEKSDPEIALAADDKKIGRVREKSHHVCVTANDGIDKSLPLTGDPEIDEEIIAFYKAKQFGEAY